MLLNDEDCGLHTSLSQGHISQMCRWFNIFKKTTWEMSNKGDVHPVYIIIKLTLDWIEVKASCNRTLEEYDFVLKLIHFSCVDHTWCTCGAALSAPCGCWLIPYLQAHNEGPYQEAAQKAWVDKHLFSTDHTVSSIQGGVYFKKHRKNIISKSKEFQILSETGKFKKF